MKIALAINSSSGLFNFRKDLILQMLADGHDVIALTPIGDRSEQLEALGIRLISTEIDRRGLNPIHDLSLFFQYRRILKSEKPDLVITYTIKPNVYCGYACRMAKIAYAANNTGLGSTFEKNNLLKRVVVIMNKVSLRYAKCVFFENENNKNLFVNEGIVKKEKAVLLNGAGVNLEHFYYQTYPDDSKGIRFLFMGRVMKEKGIEELFSSMQRLKAKGFDCYLDVLGSLEEKYEGQIRQFEKAGWLNYYGYQSDVRPFIERSHCFVLPSYHEGMANTNLESAASGRPIITSDIPGCMEAVLDERSGFLCRAKDADDLYIKMVKFLSLSQSERKQMGLVGRKHMEASFDKKIIVNKTIEQLY